ncbi:hypothetical protein PPYR_09495 [Photinus pyralis]|uniref:Uncharacterized protein n=1 Tax=Photinus pyralis TaxID=7054 RepID=A0A5N4AMC3_PHOPY|nr:hypothetical protein PPYR_09495 [Photinus pyralis]
MCEQFIFKSNTKFETSKRDCIKIVGYNPTIDLLLQADGTRQNFKTKSCTKLCSIFPRVFPNQKMLLANNLRCNMCTCTRYQLIFLSRPILKVHAWSADSKIAYYITSVFVF